MSSLVKHIVRFFLFVLVQVFVLYEVPPLHHLVTPYLYFLYILWLPFKLGRRSQMVLAFTLGFAVDSFTKTYGLHMVPCVFIAYLRPFLINLLITREGAESNYSEPSIRSMGFAPYFTYITILTFLHHVTLFFLQSMQTGGYWYFLVKALLSTAVSLVLILLTELIFGRRQRVKANAI